MILLQAPYELIETSIFLPNPLFSDTVGLGLAINQKVSINNTRYTYVKRKGRRKLNYSFMLSLDKSFELQNFIAAYTTSNIKLTNHKDEIWIVKFVSDPFTFTSKTRDERVQIELTFEGTRLYAASINC